MRDYISSAKEISLKVQLHKTARREGLIRARIFGANIATGDVINYLVQHSKFMLEIRSKNTSKFVYRF